MTPAYAPQVGMRTTHLTSYRLCYSMTCYIEAGGHCLIAFSNDVLVIYGISYSFSGLYVVYIHVVAHCIVCVREWVCLTV